MKYMTTSSQLIKNTKHFLKIKKYSILNDLLCKKGIFYGWGRKKSGIKAVELAKEHNSPFILLEDGFIRSCGLGVEGSPSFSLVEDDVGIYYDATQPSKLENILNSYDFLADTQLMKETQRAISLIKKYNISKYNNTTDIPDDYFNEKYQSRILIIAQTSGDSSLEYGMLESYTTEEIIQDALNDNPNSSIYLKVHPDVLSGQKKSDIDLVKLDSSIRVITENFNPISLLKYFDKVYTKTSGMGFEALLVQCECVCYGMPFYAGWGVTQDKSICTRRKRKLSVEEIFAAAYILYTRYCNPYEKRKSDIIDTIISIVTCKNHLKE